MRAVIGERENRRACVAPRSKKNTLPYAGQEEAWYSCSTMMVGSWRSDMCIGGMHIAACKFRLSANLHDWRRRVNVLVSSFRVGK